MGGDAIRAGAGTGAGNRRLRKGKRRCSKQEC